MLDADLTTIRKGGGPQKLFDALQQQFGRLTVDVSDFIGRGAGSPLFSLLFLALKAKGAKDWKTGLGLSLSHQGKYHYIQYHYIFPKALIKQKYERKEINEIANMAFVSGRFNREISDTKPEKYLPKIVENRGEEAFTTHAIPLDSDLYLIENYRLFLETRRKMLTDEINSFLEKVKDD